MKQDSLAVGRALLTACLVLGTALLAGALWWLVIGTGTPGGAER